MYQIDVPSAASVLPAPTAAGVAGYFTDGDLPNGVAPTIVPAEFLNTLMLESLGLIKGAGITPQKSATNQTLLAVEALAAQAVANYQVPLRPYQDSSSAPASTLYVDRAVAEVGGYYQDVGTFANSYVVPMPLNSFDVLSAGIKGAWMASATAETITGGGLVRNGDFSTNDLSAFTSVGGCVLSVVGGRLRATKTGATSYGEFYLPASLFVTGRRYKFSIDYVNSNYDHAVGVNQPNEPPYTVPLTQGLRTVAVDFVADGGIIGIVFNGVVDTTYAEFDNFVVKLADEDRSAASNSLTVDGTLTKTPVAVGAQLVGYSGFSASNYLEQPYSSALDFGTGDFCVMGWFNLAAVPASGTIGLIVARAAAGLTGAGFEVFVDQSSKLEIATTANGFAASSSVASAATVPTNTPVFAAFVRRAGVLEIWINGVKDAQTAASADNLTNAVATLRFGVRQDNSFAFNGSLALWRAFSTAPSAEQILRDYQRETKLFQAGATFAPVAVDHVVSFRMRTTRANTGPAMIDFGTGSVPLYTEAGGALAAGDVSAASIMAATYDPALGYVAINEMVPSQLGTLAREGIGQGLEDDGAGNLRVKLSDGSLRRTTSGVQSNDPVLQITTSAAGTLGAGAHASTLLVTGAAVTVSVPATSTLWNGWNVTIIAQGGPVTFQPNAADRMNGGVPGAPYTLVQGQSVNLVSDGAGSWWSLFPTTVPGAYSPRYINASQTLGAGSYLVDTSAGAITVTLPAGASAGTALEFKDATGTWSVNPLTLARNGYTILGQADNLVWDVPGEVFTIWFNGSDWRIF